MFDVGFTELLFIGLIALLVLGPEGGFSRGEVERAEQKGFRPVSLGPRVLRADTATIAACTLVQYLYGDMGKT